MKTADQSPDQQAKPAPIAGKDWRAWLYNGWDFSKAMIYALLLALIFRSLCFQPFSIPSGSMVPTLLEGDYLFVSKYSYGYSRYSLPFSLPLFKGRLASAAPQRGDIAVFRLPTDTSKDYIKRVIGLPGEKIQIIDGVVHINDTALRQKQEGSVRINGHFGQIVTAQKIREYLPNGRSHIIHNTGNYYIDNTPAYIVPPGHYFMMGDNRDHSSDSRDLYAVGYVPAENFIGRAEMIFFSIETDASIFAFWRWPKHMRGTRFFQTLR